MFKIQRTLNQYMKEIISKTFNRKQSTPKTIPNIKKNIKDENNNLTVFEPKLHIRVRPKRQGYVLWLKRVI